MFEGFADESIETTDARITVRHGGTGPPLLLLHGYPQTHVMWHKAAPRTANVLRLSFAPTTAGHLQRRRRAVVPSLTQTSANVPLVQPGAKYLGQINQLDFSLGKSVRLGGQRRVRLSLDMFNTLNSSVILIQITTWGPSLGQPQEIIEGRLFRIRAQFHF